MSLFRSTPKDPRAEAERLFAAAADKSAPELGPLAIKRGRDYVTERYELQPTFKAKLEVECVSARPRPRVSPRLKVDLTRWYTAIGPFDISLDWQSKAIAYGELKAGPDTNALVACVWDAPKLALMVRTDAAPCGHLVACSPEPLWRPETDGIELFFAGEWEMRDLRKRHASWWKKWEKQGYMPLRIPDRLRTTAVHIADFKCAGKPWRLGVARVEPLGDGWYDWEPFFP